MGGTPSVPKTNAPLRACIHTIQNRPGQFDDPAAITQQLPIVSGRIESSHRSFIQKRLKIPEACWKLEYADSMLAPRVARKNQRWTHYWQQHTPTD